MSDLGQELERLRRLIAQWNANRLDLFEISQPAEDLTFHGVMRFFYHEAGSKVATKCLRVANTATCAEVVHVLFEKFRPDMRMLTTTSANYCLCEVRGNGNERYLDDTEKPLLVQLNWHRDDLEGRFTLRRRPAYALEAAVLTPVTAQAENDKPDGVFRRLSRRMSGRRSRSKERTDKGGSKRSSSLSRLSRKSDSRRSSEVDVLRGSDRARSVSDISGAESDASPERVSSTFTRSISNPEAVMRRRREQKIIKKINSFRGKNGKPDSGGALKVYGGELMPSVPYKTILASVDDKVSAVIRQALDKYGLEDVDSNLYSLSMAVQPRDSNNPALRQERKLNEEESPLQILQSIQEGDVQVTFHINPKNGHVLGNKQGVGQAPWFLKRGDHPSNRRVRTEPNSPNLSEQRRHGGSAQGLNMEDTQQTLAAAPVHKAQSMGLLHQSNAFNHKEQLTVSENKQVAMARSETHIAHGKGNQHSLSSQSRHALPDHHQSSPSVHKSASHEYAAVHRQRFSKSERQLSDGKREGSAPEGGYLPCVLIVQRGQEDRLLQFVVTDAIPSEMKFKLSPAYTLYLSARCLLRRSAHNEPQRVERKRNLCSFLNKAITRINMSLEDVGHQAEDSAFWLANSSELLHFMKNDPKLSSMTYSCQDGLHGMLDCAFNSLTNSFHEEMHGYLPAFLSDFEDSDPHHGGEEGSQPQMDDFMAFMQHCLQLLQSSLLNATILVQVFSQLFHYTSALLFNQVVSPQRGLCSQRTGVLLLERLHLLQQWSKDNGLEMASSMNLVKITQTAKLLASSKSRYQDAAAITASCFKLNSLQIAAILRLYRYEEGEPPMLPGLAQQLVLMAENTIDEILLSENVEVCVEEEERLPSNFSLPEERFSCDVVIGVPPGLQEFLQQLTNTGVGQFALSPKSDGSWMSWKPTSPTELTQPVSVSGDGRPLSSEETVPQPGQSDLSDEANSHAREATVEHAQLDRRPEMSPADGHLASKQLNPLLRNQRAGSGRVKRSKPPQSPPTVPPPPPTQDEDEKQVQLVNGETAEETVVVDGVLLPVREVTIFKGKEGLGISIVGGVGVESVVGDSGIYIKTVIPGRAAHRDGCLEEGDQLLAIDGHNLIGISQEEAAGLVRQTGEELTIRVAKQAFSIKRDLRQHLLAEQEHEGIEGELPAANAPTSAHEDLTEADRDAEVFNVKNGEGLSQDELHFAHDQGPGEVSSEVGRLAPVGPVAVPSPKTKPRRLRRLEQADSSSAENTPKRLRKKCNQKLSSVREGGGAADSESLASVTEDNLKSLKLPTYPLKRRVPNVTNEVAATNGHVEQSQLMLWLKEQQQQRAMQQEERERSQQVVQRPSDGEKGTADESSLAESGKPGDGSDSGREHSSDWISENPSVSGTWDQGRRDEVHLQQAVEYWADDDSTALAVRTGQKWNPRQQEVYHQQRSTAMHDKQSPSSDTTGQEPNSDDFSADPVPYTTVPALFQPQGKKAEHSSPQRSSAASHKRPVYAQPQRKRSSSDGSIGSAPEHAAVNVPDVRYAQVNKPNRSEKQLKQKHAQPNQYPPSSGQANHHPPDIPLHPQTQPIRPKAVQPVHPLKSPPQPPTRADGDRNTSNAWYEAVDITGNLRGNVSQHNSGSSHVRQAVQSLQAGVQQPTAGVGKPDTVQTVGQSTSATSGGMQSNSRTTSPPAQHGPSSARVQRPPPPLRRDSLLTHKNVQNQSDPHGAVITTRTSPPHTQSGHFQGSYPPPTSSQSQRPSQPIVSAGNQPGQLFQNGVRAQGLQQPAQSPPNVGQSSQHLPHSHTPVQVQTSSHFTAPSQTQRSVPVRSTAVDPQHVQASTWQPSPSSSQASARRTSPPSPAFPQQSQKWHSGHSPSKSPPVFPQPSAPPAYNRAPAPLPVGHNGKHPSEDSFRSPNAPKGGSHFTFNAAPRPSSPNMVSPFETPYSLDMYPRGRFGSYSQPTSGTVTPRYLGQPGMVRPTGKPSGPVSNGAAGMPQPYNKQTSHIPPYAHQGQKAQAVVHRSGSLNEKTFPAKHHSTHPQVQPPYPNQHQQQSYPSSQPSRIRRPEMDEMMHTPSSSTQSINKIPQAKGKERQPSPALTDLMQNDRKRFFGRNRPSGSQPNGLPPYSNAQHSANSSILARPPWHAEPGLV